MERREARTARFVKVGRLTAEQFKLAIADARKAAKDGAKGKSGTFPEAVLRKCVQFGDLVSPMKFETQLKNPGPDLR